MNSENTRTGRVVVVGGGISGLAAAHRLAEAGVHVTVVEAAERLGGKLRAGEVAGVPVDLGAEALFARQPEAVELARSVGLAERLQPAATTASSVWTRGALRPMPARLMMGVPGDPADVAPSGILSEEGLARIAKDRELPRTEVGEDIGVGEYVAKRLGQEVVDRLVEPLLGGLHAGGAERISMRAVLPQLLDAARSHDSLLDGIQDLQRRAAARPAPTGPLFMGIDGGIGLLPDALADAIRAADGQILTGTTVHGLTRTATGWKVRTDDRILTAEGVVLATPAWATSALLAPHAPAAAEELADMEYGSMAIVTMAFRRADMGEVPAGSGFLVPPIDGRTIKAATFSSNKWSWQSDAAPDLFVLRTSIGRHGEEYRLQYDDTDLVYASLADLRAATGLTATPVAGEVTRWIDGLPQYTVGHAARVQRIREETAKLPGLQVCGALYDGVGITNCIAGGQRAADSVAAVGSP